jgi:hypothetical protein
MERIRALIDKLQQQADDKVDIAAMKVTVLILQAELEKISAVSYTTSPSKISVVLPGGGAPSYQPQPAPRPAPAPEPRAAEKPAPVPEVRAAERPAPAPVPKPEPVVNRPEPVAEPVMMERESVYAPKPAAPPPSQPLPESSWQPDPVQDKPAVSQQREMNEMLGRPAPSINDRLRSEQTELGSVLVDSPVKDLKKAIGINDRFVFLHDLFRGDESMYERSIRTINNFHAYPEAEYWIERELKIKLGWDNHKDSVRYFMQLVRRRFI